MGEAGARKVFGTGLPRTGTTSLALAFLQFGLRTAHSCFDGRLYNRGDAFVDTPVYADFAKLDLHFPGSLFVHTTRDPESWYASVETTLGEFVKFLAASKPKDPRVATDQRAWRQTFGALALDRDEYLKRREAHEAAVLAHFKDRPGQLLVIDVADGDKLWKPLADFLGRPVPDGASFPRANRGTARDWQKLVHPLKLDSWWPRK